MKTIKKLWSKYRGNLREIALYIASSVLSTAFDWAVYLLFLYVCGAGVQVSYSVGKVSSGILNFAINNFVVFRRGAGFGLIKRGLGYALTVVFSLIVGNLVMLAFTMYVGLGEELAKLITDVLCFFINYFLQKVFVFNHR